jgi:outer membrane immunogenic protein
VYAGDLTNGDWSGFYLGGHAGSGTVSADLSSEYANGTGMFAGAHAGYNFTSGNMVYGVEANFDAGSLLLCENDVCEDNWGVIQSIGSVRARVGITFDNLLFYGTAGTGLISGYAASSSDGSDSGPVSLSTTLIGLGVEMALSRNTSARLEVVRYMTNGRYFEGNGSDIDPDSDLTVVSVGITVHF